MDKTNTTQWGIENKPKKNPPTSEEWIPDACTGDKILSGECKKVKG